MNKKTAVVLDRDQSGRDEIRVSLLRCGVLPICFHDEWICLENIYHLKPRIVVFRPISIDMACHFLNVAISAHASLTAIVLTDQENVKSLLFKRFSANLIFLPIRLDHDKLERVIDSIGLAGVKAKPPVIVAGSSFPRKHVDWLSSLGLSNEPLIIQGEPGVGKRLAARAIYSYAATDGSALRQIRTKDICSTWIRQIIQQIHDHERSENNLIIYVIEQIERLAFDLQAQLLLAMDRWSESGMLDHRRPAFRFIFLAEHDLAYQSRRGRFRTDLYHRLSVLNLFIPPLRNRKDDLPLLADFFAAWYGLEQRGYIVRLPEDIRNTLQAYHWPGNVAQLETVIKTALDRGVKDWEGHLHHWCDEHLGPTVHRLPTLAYDVGECVQMLMGRKRDMSLKKARQQAAMQVESRLLKMALAKTNGNCKKAAGILNISYKSMLTKAKMYNLVR